MATPATRRRVSFPYPFDKLSKPRLNQAKPEWRKRPTRPCDEAPCGSWSLNSTAQRAGLRVSETKHEMTVDAAIVTANRSEEHTSELQSRQYLVCRLLLEKKNNILWSTRYLSDHYL